MKKLSIRILLSVLLVAVVAVGGTLAYLMASDSPLLNTFALAEVETEIEEPQTDTAANKTAKVVNTGKAPVYVRARVVISGGDAAVLESDNLITFTYNTEAWQDGDDGFYYYMGILPAESGENSKTPALFTGVDVDEDVPKEAEFSVDVYQESVLAPSGTGVTWTLDAAQAAFEAKANPQG